MVGAMDPRQLATAFRNACLAELEAIKPGNVHIFSDGHGMVVEDFVRSAEAAAAVIALPGFSVGERILHAIEATWDAVGCNTNLGIVLLSAPLIAAMEIPGAADLRSRLARVLDALDVRDAELVYRAIRRAAPAGLGEGVPHDVHAPATVTLLQAMDEAAGRDRIAWQYAHGFEEIFDVGLPCYRQQLARWERPAWAASAVYMTFLSRYADSHIARKHGEAIAIEVQRAAARHAAALLAQENPKLQQRAMLDFDAELKARGLNPGTSADLTVATLLAWALENMVTDFVPS